MPTWNLGLHPVLCNPPTEYVKISDEHRSEATSQHACIPFLDSVSLRWLSLPVLV